MSLPVGSLVGAGGVTAYNAYHSNDWGIVRTLQWWVEKGNVDAARANNPEFARLEDMVQLSPAVAVLQLHAKQVCTLLGAELLLQIGRLTREMNSKGRDVYFHPASSSSGCGRILLCAAALLVPLLTPNANPEEVHVAIPDEFCS